MGKSERRRLEVPKEEEAAAAAEERMQGMVRRVTFAFGEHGMTECRRAAPAPAPERQLLAAVEDEEDPEEGEETPDLVELFARGARRG